MTQHTINDGTQANGAATSPPDDHAVGEPADAALVGRLAAGEDGLLELAAERGEAVDDLARRVLNREAPVRGALERLGEAHLVLLPAVLGRSKLVAARRLRELAQSDEQLETARRACVDLLKLTGRTGPSKASPAPADPEAELTADAEAAIRALLERLGREPAEGADA